MRMSHPRAVLGVRGSAQGQLVRQLAWFSVYTDQKLERKLDGSQRLDGAAESRSEARSPSPSHDTVLKTKSKN